MKTPTGCPANMVPDTLRSGLKQDGPGSAPTLWFRGLADWIGVD